MVTERKFMVDVGMKNLPFPMRVPSKMNSRGQETVSQISIVARIMQEFEARWIDKFIEIIHRHRDEIGTIALKNNIREYLKELNATSVKIDIRYPFFVEKTTPVSKEKCIVQYVCTYSVKATSIDEKPGNMFIVEIPVITTYPGSSPETPGGLFGQLSVIEIEIESGKDIFPEEIVEIADRNALAPIYSFLTPDDQLSIIKKIHSEVRTSVATTDGIKEELARDNSIDWYRVKTSNFGMLHSYSTVISTEKNMWVPFSTYTDEP